MKRNFRNLLMAGLLAAASPLVAPMANAQEMGMPLAHMGARAEKLATQLKLSPDQRAQWDALIQKSKAQFEAMHKAHREMHEAMKAELAKPEPDLAALAAKADEMRDKGRAAHRELRDGWLKLYAGFSVEQKGVVRKEIQKHMSRFDKMHHMMEHMRDRMKDMHERHHGPGRDGDKDYRGATPPPPPARN